MREPVSAYPQVVGPASSRSFRTGKMPVPHGALGGTVDRRAVALVMVLWAVAALALISGGLAFALRQNLATTRLCEARIHAHAMAKAGVQRAIAAVMDHHLTTCTLQDLWCDDPDRFRNVALEDGTFSVMHGSEDALPLVLYGAEDESAKLNVNAATKEQLLKLPDMTESIAAAIIDWRDEDDDPEPPGIEGSYYQSLAHPYVIRNSPLRTVRELLLVRGVTPDLLYGEDTNADGLLDDNENDSSQRPPTDNADGRLDRGWFAWLTVYSYERNVNGVGRKRINITDADAETLASNLALEQWAAQSIVKAREQKKFEHLVDLLAVTRDTAAGQSNQEDDLNTRSTPEKDTPVTQQIFERIVDNITLKNDEVLPGRININTAPREVLMTLPEVDEKLANAIVQRRTTQGSFTTIGGLLEVSGLGRDEFGKIEDSITVRSSVFRIRSQGSAEGGLAQATIDCVVDKGGTIPRVLYWSESSP